MLGLVLKEGLARALFYLGYAAKGDLAPLHSPDRAGIPPRSRADKGDGRNMAA